MEKTTLELFKEYYNEITNLTINYSTTQPVYPIEAVRAAIDLLSIDVDRQALLERQKILEEKGKVIAEAFLDKMEELKR
jgi:hypothetical protein